MISTVFDLLSKLKEKGISEIEPYLDIGHNPTIGDMYEGLTKKILQKSIFEGLNLKVSSGKIRNNVGILSKQIDCMLVVGEGEQIPYTSDFIYDVGKVIAVIEVKKNLFTSDLANAYHNLKSVYDLSEPEGPIDITMMAHTFEMITKIRLPAHEEISKLSIKNQMLYNALLVETFVPVRIIFGYDGFKDEESLRTHFIEYVNSQMDESGQAKGFGAVSLPNLIICGDNSIIKTNGYPYILALKTDDWILCASYNKSPLLIFLEIIWTRITQKFKISSINLFDEDLDMEYLHPLLIACSDGTGWFYDYISLEKEELNNTPTILEWQPVYLNDVEFCLMNKLCAGKIVKANDVDFINFAEENGYKISDIIEHLNDERLITVEEGELRLLTKQCVCMITPNGFVAGDNKDNRVMNWVKRHGN